VSDGSGRLIMTPYLRLAGRGVDIRLAAATLSGSAASTGVVLVIFDLLYSPLQDDDILCSSPA